MTPDHPTRGLVTANWAIQVVTRTYKSLIRNVDDNDDDVEEDDGFWLDFASWARVFELRFNIKRYTGYFIKCSLQGNRSISLAEQFKACIRLAPLKYWARGFQSHSRKGWRLLCAVACIDRGFAMVEYPTPRFKESNKYQKGLENLTESWKFLQKWPMRKAG